MKAVFGDTVYFLALVNSTDQYHTQAVTLSRESGERLVTTEWVLMEVGDALSQPQNRPKFARLLELLERKLMSRLCPQAHTGSRMVVSFMRGMLTRNGR